MLRSFASAPALEVGKRTTAAAGSVCIPRYWASAGRAFGVVALYTFIYTGLFSPVVFAGHLLAPGDGCIVFLAGFRSARWAWDPTLFAGFPGLADPQRMGWYPPALLAAMLPDGWNALVISGYVLASCFTYAYVRRLTDSSLGAGVAGLVYGMSGFLIAHLGHVNMVHASAWLPLVLYTFERLRERAAPAWIAAAGSAIACSILAGHPQISAYSLALLGAYTLVGARAAPAGCRQYCAAAVAAVGLGFALSAILLLPMHQLTKGSVRTAMDYTAFCEYSLPLKQLPPLVFPYAHGGTPETPFKGEGNLTETTAYVGILPALLAVFGTWSAVDRRSARFWLAVAACAFLLALGPDGGLSALVYHVPMFNKFRCPARHLGELSLAASVLSGWGMASLSAAPLARRIGGALMATVAVSTAVVGAYLALQNAGISLAWHAQAARVSLAALAVAPVVLWISVLRPTKLSRAVLLAAVAMEMAGYARCGEWLWQYADERMHLACPPLLTKYREEFVKSGQRVTGLPSRWTPPEAALANLAAIWQLPCTSGYHPLVTQRIMDLLDMHRSGNGFMTYNMLSDDDLALDLLASRYVVVPDNAIKPDSPVYDGAIVRYLNGSTRFRYVDHMYETSSFENPRAMPRAWLVVDVLSLSQGDVLRAVHGSRLPDGSRFDPARSALVEEACSFAPAGADSAHTAAAKELAPGKVQVETESQSATFCVLSDIYYPGWRVTVDGQPAKIFRTDYVLMGVELPPGRHTVLFEYIPTRFYVGAGITCFALLVVAALLAAPMRRPKRDGVDSVYTLRGQGAGPARVATSNRA
ncbi:MAG TPA: YfhO family protein [Pirellulales bacterium]|nr:YfhO family protein [Pirellulales bacterium]